ncbi:MAG: ABC transporter ATP-binding protein [Pirellulaceae bacterium]|nr:ABC transporter ATP-binding protein [Pirellulaceae bacterium]
MNGSVIEIEALQVQRDRRAILSIERLSVRAGEVLVVLGPNGAGKSTLLKALIGMVRCRPGHVRVLGADVGALRSAALTRLRRRVAYLAQTLAPGSEMPLTLREIVAIGRTGCAGLLRPLARGDWQRVDHWIACLGLQPIARRPYAALSGGEQRKALLAMAMVQQPEVLLLDEPTANLDAFWREQMVAALTELHRTAALTIVLVCHDLEAIPPTTDRVLILQAGRPVAHGPCDVVLTQEHIESLYGRGLAVGCRAGRYLLVPQPAQELTP